MRAAIACLAVLVVGSGVAADRARFTAGPKAARDGEKVAVTFTVSAATDVEVAVLDAAGRVVRHLAAGVLGGRKPPPAPLKPALSQRLEWDGKDDFARPAKGGPFRVRVRLGTGVKFGRFIGGDDPHMLGLIEGMAGDEQGNLYVMGFREEDFLGCMTLRMFSPDGRYLRTIMPFPADLSPGAAKEFADWDDAKACFRPRNFRNCNVQFYGSIGGKAGGALHLVRASGRKGILLTDGAELFALDSRGAPVGETFATRRLWGPGRPPRCGRTFTAVSPDGEYLYVSGRYSAKSRYGHKYDPRYPPGVVYRLKLTGSGPLEPFVTVPVEHQEGLGGNWTTDGGGWVAYGVSGDPKGAVHGVAVDARGRVYVADRERGRVAVYDEKGKEVAHVDVRFPEYVFVHPKTGAVFVLDKRCVPRKRIDLKLLKFDSIEAGARPSAEFEIPRVSDRVRMTASYPDGRALFWLRTSLTKTGKYELLVLEDKGRSFEPVQTAYRIRKDGQWGWHRLAVDYGRDEVYGSDGTVGMWRYDGRTGKGERLVREGKPFWSQDLAVGCDGLLYVRQGRGYPEFQDYSGPFARFTRDLKPAPYPASGSHVLRANVYSREGPGYAERGIGVGPDGKAYISFMHAWVKYWILCYGPDGKFVEGKHVEAKEKDGKVRRATIGPLTAANGGIRVDLAGNIYVGMWVWPKDVPVPEAFAKDLSYLASTGSVVRFTPDGGFLTSPRADWSSDPVGSTPRTPGAGGIEARSGYRGRNLCYDVFIQGATAAYPGLAPFSHANWGANTCCVCRTPRFDLDRYGRLYLPNAITNSVRIVDNAGNEIVQFGRYGNFDSLYVNPNLPEGRQGRPTVAVPAIPLGWPTAAGVSRDAIYVCDTYNRRAVRVEPTWAAEKTCPVP